MSLQAEWSETVGTPGIARSRPSREVFPGSVPHYSVVAANNPLLRRHEGRIRHAVYCEELKYEEQNPQGIEIDHYDIHAVHLLLKNNLTRMFCGCFRIIHGRLGHAVHALPFETTCKSEQVKRHIADARETGEPYAEISRFSLLREQRGGRAPTDATTGDRIPTRDSLIALQVLVLGVFATCKAERIKTVFALMEERLKNYLVRTGCPVEVIGEAVEHRGQRIPIRIETDDAVERMPMALRPFYNEVADRLYAELRHREASPSFPRNELSRAMRPAQNLERL